eukprot:TCALIF_05527-PA protein Name:"Protein of unknown function" AED:0.20 eAED:0.23 QI:0/0/0/0.5/1/1/2/0/154
MVIADHDLERELLCMDNPTLAQLKAKCESWEEGGANLAALQGKSYVNAVRCPSRKPDKSGSWTKSQSALDSGSCGRCGFHEHVGPNCPAKNKVCRHCGKRGHFQRVCESVEDPEDQGGSMRVKSKRASVQHSSAKKLVQQPLHVQKSEFVMLLE